MIVRPNARGWRREGFLGGVGGVPRFVSLAHVRAWTCGRCAFIWGKLGNSGKKASPATSPARPIPQRCGGPLARSSDGVFAVLYTLDTLRIVSCFKSSILPSTASISPFLLVSGVETVVHRNLPWSSVIGPSTDHLPSEMLANRAWRCPWFPSGRLDISPRAWSSRWMGVVAVHLGGRY